jgi:uncharacterized protein with ParB-like and HNH nuclease domain
VSEVMEVQKDIAEHEIPLKDLQPSIITVADLLVESRITFPNYQRPYKWEIKHVNQLINDIVTFKHKPAYRLGTVVIHLDENDLLNIVDGQQRTITLLLITKAVLARIESQQIELKNEELKRLLKDIKSKIPKPQLLVKLPYKTYKEIMLKLNGK